MLAFVRNSREVRGISPTIAEIAERLNVSRPTVHEHVERLLQSGHLRRYSQLKARALIPADELNPRPPMTRAQKQCLDTILYCIRETGEVPTFRGLAAEMEQSTAALYDLVSALRQKGYLAQTRAIQPVDAGKAVA